MMTTTTNTTETCNIVATLFANGERDALVDLLATLADRGDIEGCEVVAAALDLLG